jgi:hypothetical protein
MVYDDIIIGSGLTALATAYGLPPNRRVLVLTGGKQDRISYYDINSKIPCQNFGFGGLGSYWHGVIPMHYTEKLSSIPDCRITEIFQLFYPNESLTNLINSPWLFIPYKPIRPKPHWHKLSESRSDFLKLANTSARKIHQENNLWAVQIDNNQYMKSTRLWIAAGALGTPALLEESEDYSSSVLSTVSDHLILYVGQINRKIHPHIPTPQIKHTSNGYWMKASSDFGNSGLMITKPAYFAYKTLDQGIEQRSAFGLPTSGIMKKVISAGSLGFITESIFNKFGLLPNSSVLSLYAQIRVKDGYRRLPQMQGVQADEKCITTSIKNFRNKLKQEELLLSRRPDLYIHGIHMHRTLNSDILSSLGIDTETSSCAIVDASAIDDIGSEHHSFRLMVRAFHRASIS